MRIRFNTLLIICSFFLGPFLQVGANSVSGQYAFPRNSIKFEKQKEFSLLPVGWSKNGNAAFVVINKSTQTMSLSIIDSIEDTLLWESAEYDLRTQSMAVVWNQMADTFSNHLAEFDIIPQNTPVYGGLNFTTSNDNFLLFHDETNLVGQNRINTLSLKIQSEKRGVKNLYKYVQDQNSGRFLMGFQVLGYFKSPWENRIIVLSSQEFVEGEEEAITELKFSGAHLTIGYVKEVTSDNQLIDSVLSGQFYNSRNLLKNGADPNIHVAGGKSLILMAAHQFNWDIVQLLYEYKASLAVVDQDNRTLLHYAVLDGNLEIVRMLMVWGINTNFRDNNGETAIALAKRLNRQYLF